MNLGWLAFLCASLLAPITASLNFDAYDDPASEIASLREEIASLDSALKEQSMELKTRLGALTRQMILQQLFVEERIRSEGQSGIKQIRNGLSGTKSYDQNSHVDARMVAIHDHANNIRTIGMGEFIAVLNGVEFRTRHNDYALSMPSRNTSEYHKTEHVPFPDVPPEVTSKESVTEQVEEMKEWFKAFYEQNHTVRDYRPYFKPVLSYLEGGWGKSPEMNDEAFDPSRHFSDPKNWYDLQEKICFTSYTGRKNLLDNFSYLPTTVIDFINETEPVVAQLNFRILCHPLKDYLPVNRLRLVDELESRLRWKRTFEKQKQSRAARFQVNPKDSDHWKDRPQPFGLLDKLMSEIPGKDNYPANIVDGALGQEAYSMDPEKPNEKLNAGYYHRWYKVLEKGAMGIQTRIRGFSDPNLFVAMTNQPKVAGMKLNHCKGTGPRKICNKYEQKLSYAIPLEIIYLTPLNKWNPYNITYKGHHRSTLGRTVNANGRNGGKTESTAYDGVHNRIYCITPNSFFTGNETHDDPADTTKDSVGVLDSTRRVRMVRSSGVRIFLPDIPGVGILRQRYPIMPIHVEGSTAWKEIQAVGDFLMESKKHQHLFREKLSASDDTGGTPEETYLVLRMRYSRSGKVSRHYHEAILSAEQVVKLKAGGNITLATTENNGHQHEITIKWNRGHGFYMAFCASTPEKTRAFDWKCKDSHPALMGVVKE